VGVSVGEGAGSVGVGESVLDGDGESVGPATATPRGDWRVPAVAIPAPTTSASSTLAAVSGRATRRAMAVDFILVPPRDGSGRMVIDYSKPSPDRMGLRLEMRICVPVPHQDQDRWRSRTVSHHAAVHLGGGEQPDRLLRRWRVIMLGRHLRRRGVRGRVLRDPLPPHGVAEEALDDGVDRRALAGWCARCTPWYIPNVVKSGLMASSTSSINVPKVASVFGARPASKSASMRSRAASASSRVAACAYR
jgi:hypothetical protein